MGADPEALLAKLEPGQEVAAGTVRGLAGALAVLVERGLVTARKDGKVSRVIMTEAGVARRAAAPAPAPKPRKTPASAAPPDHRLDRVIALLGELVERVGRLEAALAPATRAPAPADLTPVKDAVLGAVAELDARGRLGGLVPIPDLRHALRARGVDDDASVTAALEALEREWRIDLNVAQAPTAVADRAAGIERPGRGLLYYVSRR